MSELRNFNTRVTRIHSAVMNQKIDDVRRIIEAHPQSVNEIKSEYRNRTPIFTAILYANRLFNDSLDENIIDLLLE